VSYIVESESSGRPAFCGYVNNGPQNKDVRVFNYVPDEFIYVDRKVTLASETDAGRFDELRRKFCPNMMTGFRPSLVS
jgi:hypothetical protein